MDVSFDVRKFLRSRRERAVGSILGYAEAEIRSKLTKDEWESLRRVVLDATNSYHDTVLDLVKSEDVARNDHLIALLESVDASLRYQRREAVTASDAQHQETKDRIVRDQRRQDEVWTAPQSGAGEPTKEVAVDFSA